VFTKDDTWQEGDLTACRDKLVSNNKLCDLAMVPSIDLTRYIITDAHPSKAWYGPGIVSTKEFERDISVKTVADCVEALTGAVLMSTPRGPCGQPRWRSSSRFLRQVGMPFQRYPDSYAAFARLADNPAYADDSLEAEDVLPVEAIIGYHFRHPGLLAEALTHQS
jgi:dsRNA-specific ribonuclease